MKSIRMLFLILVLAVSTALMAQEGEGGGGTDTLGSVSGDYAQAASPYGYALGGVFGAVSIDGMNYQQIGLRPEIKLWKLGIGLDITLLFDDEGKIRKEDWNEWKDYLDKIYYVRWGQKGDPFYFRYGGLAATTLGYGTLITGYTNMLEYPTYKRQGLELGIETNYMGMEFIANDLKELSGGQPGFMGGGRLYIKPFSRLQIGGSIAGDLNEYKGLRDTDGDGIPDEMDAYPENKHYATEFDYYEQRVSLSVAEDLRDAGEISGITKADLMDVNKNRSRTGFWAADMGLKLLDLDFFKVDVYTQYAMCLNTGGWGYTLPGVRIRGGSLFEIFADYRQQSDDFIFGYYNDTYDLERAKYIYDASATPYPYYIQTKKDKLEAAEESKGYMAGMRINLFELAYGKIEYQDMRWGDLRDKSLKGEVALNKNIIPMVSKAKAYYAQNNVNNFRLKSESTIMGAVLGIGMSENVSIDFNYLITFQDKDGNGEIEGSDETITNISVSTSTVF